MQTSRNPLPKYYIQHIVQGKVIHEIYKSCPMPLPLARNKQVLLASHYKPGFLKLKGVYL